MTKGINVPFLYIMNIQHDASDHLVEIPLHVAFLHVNLLVGLDHILQLLLSLFPLLKLGWVGWGGGWRRDGGRDVERGEGGKKALTYISLFLLCQLSNLLAVREKEAVV